MSPTLGSPNCCGAFTCLPFFVAGIVSLALVEFLLVLYLLERLLNISSRPSASPVSDLKVESEDNSMSVEVSRLELHCFQLPVLELGQVQVCYATEGFASSGYCTDDRSAFVYCMRFLYIP